MAQKPRALGKKKPKAVDHPVGVQVPLPVQDPILALPDPIQVEPSLPSSHILRKRKGKASDFAAVELRRQDTMADTSRDHKKCLALGKIVMLSQDVAHLAAEDLAEFIVRLIMQHVQSLQRAEASSVGMKKYSSDAKKALKKTYNLDSDLKMAKEKLVVEETAR
ncbi:hypothetical protein Acr_09g0006300 [Actinidia rufa]|uniref:Uncharacterized protein n=1 Tax=Actinidia rufa TaxID=165716 RepID=A0A7J0F663_9ERIC|nr:hypothetical protein Acr_09g0006300 [Actinidia rufa]